MSLSGRNLSTRRSLLPFANPVMPIQIVRIAVPRNARSFNNNFVLEGGQFGIKLRQVKPSNRIIIHDFEPEDIVTFQWKILKQVMQSDVILADHDPEHVGGLLVVVVLGNVVVD